MGIEIMLGPDRRATGVLVSAENAHLARPRRGVNARGLEMRIEPRRIRHVKIGQLKRLRRHETDTSHGGPRLTRAKQWRARRRVPARPSKTPAGFRAPTFFGSERFRKRRHG